MKGCSRTMDINGMVISVVAILIGALAFAKPVIMYNSMKNRISKSVSCLHFFVMGIVYIALSVGLLSFFYDKNRFAPLFFAIFFLLGLWNAYYGYLVIRLKKGNPDSDAEKPETKS